MISADGKSLSLRIKEKAGEAGFDLCGIAPSKALTDHESVLKTWCSSGMNGEMSYLGNDIERRTNPGVLFPGAKSVIVAGLNYYTDKLQAVEGVPVISRYAFGADYHNVITGKLNIILEYLCSVNPGTQGKSFVDSSPVLEKAWAREAGLGWPGRHSVLINDRIGSFFFIGIIITDIELEYDIPYKEDHCGHCRLCIESCPTGAINENRTIDARKCIAYLTIEDKNPVNEMIIPKLEGRVFGCDICQMACPWNKSARQHSTAEFDLSSCIRDMTVDEWKNLSQDRFNRLFEKMPVKRRKYWIFYKNVQNIISSKKPKVD
jgi:epoxyqueuosine reductase